MRPDEPIVSFHEFLDHMDRATAAFEPASLAAWEAWTRGTFRGEWCLLWQLRELHARGETDLRRALGMVEAGLLALKRRRSHRDFAVAIERHRASSDEGGADART